MIVPIGLSLKCAEDPVPEVAEVGINCIEMLKKIILDGGFLIMGNQTLQEFNEKTKKFPKYGARFREFIRTAITLGKVHHIDSFPKLSGSKKYSKKKLIRTLTESFRNTFKIEWDTRDWNNKELKLIAECENNYKPLEFQHV